MVGGDGRYYNLEATQTGHHDRGGQWLRPRDGGARRHPFHARRLMRHPQAPGIRWADPVSASHNEGGVDGDFGIKFNAANGGPATEHITDAIIRMQPGDQRIPASPMRPTSTSSASAAIRSTACGLKSSTRSADYAELMRSLFDFDATAQPVRSAAFASPSMPCTPSPGPTRMPSSNGEPGAPAGTRAQRHAAARLWRPSSRPEPGARQGAARPDDVRRHAPDFGAASDGDGDRNLIIGRGIFVAPSDSLAMLAANAHLAPAYRAGITGVARSMPTSGAVDRRGRSRSACRCFETPTGWKYFGNLLDAGQSHAMRRRKRGTGSNHVREKDGIWAVLLWLNILAVARSSVRDIAQQHWATDGRNYYTRHDYEAIDGECCQGVDERTGRTSRSALKGQMLAGQARHSGRRLQLHRSGGRQRVEPPGPAHRVRRRLAHRLPALGHRHRPARRCVSTSNASSPTRHGHALDTQQALAELIVLAQQIARIRHHTGRAEPDVLT